VLAGRRGQGLAIGLTEANAQLLGAPEQQGAPTPAPAPNDPFALSRGRVAALHPDFIRVDVDWSKLQPSPSVAPALDGAVDGCDRGIPPCAAFAGLRDELRAIAAQQRAGSGFEPVIVIYGVPAWAAAAPAGCERPGTLPRSRPLAPGALAAYRQLIEALLALGAREGVVLHWWSAWNEPNQPWFISPQRTACSRTAAALSPGVYVTLARALRDELRAAGGDRRLLLGDLAGYVQSGPHKLSIAEFVAALPQDVVCSGSVWALHDYGVAAGDPVSMLLPVRELELALDRSGPCGRAAHIWITETGAADQDARAGVRDPLAACQRLAAALIAWNIDPRIEAAFQYTYREDPAFRVGLADPGLRTVFPAYYEWLAWGSRRATDPAPPPLAPQCA
jgi:hypothetical protein